MDFLHQVEKLLDLPRAEKARVMAELDAHWNEIVDEKIASGMEAAEAAREAEQRLGTPSDIAARLNAVHNSASWKSAMMTIAPILGAILVFDCLKLCCSKSLALNTMAYFAAAVLTVFIIAKVYCEMKAGRRPVWLATWLAASITCGHHLLRSLASRVCSGIFGEEFSLLGIYMGSHVAIVVAFALLVCWDSPKLRIAVGLGSALMLLQAIATVILRLPGGTWSEETLRDFGRIVYFALWIAIALRIFARDKFGSAFQASLFLYTYFVLGWQLVTIPQGSWLNWMYPEKLAAAIVVLICVRSYSRWHKTAVLLGGVIAIDCVYPLYQCLFVSKGAVFAANVSTTPFEAVGISLNLLLMGAAVTLPLIIAGQDSRPRVQIVK